MFVGKNLENVRLLKGLSRRNLAEKLDISEQAIWQYEVKNMMPEISKIYDLAKEFSVKTSYFLTEDKLEFYKQKVNKHSIAFRADSQTVTMKHLNKQYYQATYLTNLTDYLFSYVKTPQLYLLEVLESVNSISHNNFEMAQKERIKLVASRARDLILANETNKELLFTLEKSGVIIYEKEIDQDADAFSYWSDNEVPYIILGSNKGVAVRRNFDIAHELGHLLLHKHIQFDLLTHKEHEAIEKEANLFAAEFLLPKQQFIDDFSKITKKSNPDYFKMLKEKWYVSIQAIGMRAYFLDLMSYSQYRYFWQNISKKGYKKQEPLDQELSLSHPVKMNSLIDLLFKKKVISPQKLLDDLQIEPRFLKEIANIDEQLFERYMKSEKENKKESLMNTFIDISNYR